jgi:hypothetical protein
MGLIENVQLHQTRIRLRSQADETDRPIPANGHAGKASNGLCPIPCIARRTSCIVMMFFLKEWRSPPLYSLTSPILSIACRGKASSFSSEQVATVSWRSLGFPSTAAPPTLVRGWLR